MTLLCEGASEPATFSREWCSHAGFRLSKLRNGFAWLHSFAMLQAISCNETIALEPHCLVTFFLGGKFTNQLFGFHLWIAGSCRIVFTRYPARTLCIPMTGHVTTLQPVVCKVVVCGTFFDEFGSLDGEQKALGV